MRQPTLQVLAGSAALAAGGTAAQDWGQSVPALTRSLAGLMAEMQAEGLGPEALETIDAGAHAAHWQRALAFLRIAAGFHLGDDAPDREALQYRAARALADEGVAVTAPFGELTAGGMVYAADPQGRHVLELNRGVRLLYRP